MGRAPMGQRPLRPTGAVRPRAGVQRRRGNRLLAGGSLAVIVALTGVVVGLHAAHRSSGNGSSSAAAVPLSIGTTAPDGSFTALDGTTDTVAALRGRPTLIWFVTTWCSSCQAGTQAMAQHVGTLAADGVRVVEVENYADLGQSGPPMGTFARALAGSAASNPDWTFGEASSTLTHTYNPKAYLDLYYLVDAKGTITYVNSSPASTMPQLLNAAKALA
ncbi:MAG TPA: redoxin domain-containing protein [Acidimicrobiales bacterium]|nr:redoxin domain-containing protein [Acidimicrobiales bacterium]